MKSSRFERARCARIVCVQALYQYVMRNQTQVQLGHDILNFRIKQKHDYLFQPDEKLIQATLDSFFSNQETIHNFITTALQDGWSIDKMDRVTQAILMAASSELLMPNNMAPVPVIISEYVDITKGFVYGSDFTFVNKSLDHFARVLGKKMAK